MLIADSILSMVQEDGDMKQTDRKEGIGRAIGRIASGVFVITVNHNGRPDGIMASWVCQAAFEPPMLTIALKRERPILNLMSPGSHFTVNVLSKENHALFKAFAKSFKEGMDRFEGLQLVDKAPAGVALPEALAFMTCKCVSLIEAGDHFIVLAQVLEGAVSETGSEPMVHLRSNGFQY